MDQPWDRVWVNRFMLSLATFILCFPSAIYHVYSMRLLSFRHSGYLSRKDALTKRLRVMTNQVELYIKVKIINYIK